MSEIDFAEWLLYRYTPVTTGFTDNPYREIRKWWSETTRDFYTTSELFEIYQKEKNE